VKKLLRWAPRSILPISMGVLFHRLFAGDVIFWGTPLLQFYPWETMAYTMLRAGRLPLWNPLVGAGAPLLANYQVAIFYPPNWLYLLIPVEYGMGLLGLLHLLWAGAGMMAYLRRLGLGMLGQALGAIAFSLSGYLIGRFGFLSITSAVAWLPWLMWAVDGLLASGVEDISPARVALLAAITALQLLAGHAQTAFYSIVLAAVYTIWRAQSSQGGARARRLFGVFGGLGLGALIAAVQLVPTAELVLQSQRAGGVDRLAGLTYSFWPWRLLTLVAPNLFGSPAAGNYDGYAAYWEDAIYVGLLPLVMVGHAVARWLRERASGQVTQAARVVPFFGVMLPIVFIMALGKNSPLFMWLFDHNVPGFVTFQAPTRWMLLLEFGLCTLAAIGADAWKTSKAGLFWTRLLTAGGVSFIVAGLLASHYAGGAIRYGFIPAMFWLGGTIIVVGAASLLLPQAEAREAWRPLWEILILTVVAVDLVASHWGLNPTMSATYYHRTSALAEAIKPITSTARTLYLPDDEYQVKFKTYLDFKDFHAGDQTHWTEMRDSLLPNLGMLDGLPSASNFDPLLVGRYDALLVTFKGMPETEIVQQLQGMNVGVLLTTKTRTDLSLVARSGPVLAYQVPNPWSRASLADCTSVESSLHCQPIRTGQARLESDDGTRVVVLTTSERPAALLLLDTMYPGWSATLDGVPADIHLANGAFRAVDVPAGSHRVVFSYLPDSLLAGAGVSAVGVLVLTWLALSAARSARARNATPAQSDSGDN
jgi:Bacterial membrane protein YfhO